MQTRLSRLVMVCGMLAAALGVASPRHAAAQYKNTSFGLDASGQLITRPSIINPKTGGTYQDTFLPLRLGQAIGLGGDVNFKLGADHWWFDARLNFWFYQFTSDKSSSTDNLYDQQAAEKVGNVFGLQALAGPRWYILTDRIRPYLQPAVSYMHLFNFTSQSGDACSIVTLCPNGGTLGDVYFPHTNIFSLHAIAGIEFIVARDLAITVAFDLERWLIINADDNHALTLKLGVAFYG